MQLLTGPWVEAGAGGPKLKEYGEGTLSIRADNNDRGIMSAVSPFFHNQVLFEAKAPAGSRVRLRMGSSYNPNMNFAEWNVNVGTEWTNFVVDTRLDPDQNTLFARDLTKWIGVMFEVPNISNIDPDCFIADLAIGEIPSIVPFNSVQSYRRQVDQWFDGTLLMGEYTTRWEPFDSNDNNVGDQLYFGSQAKFDTITVLGDLFTTVDYEYFNGSWQGLGSSSYLRGTTWWESPPDWQPISVNGSVPLYFVRAVTGPIYVQYPQPTLEIAYIY